MGFKVISCTAAFTHLCGPLEGSPSLLEWIRDKDRFTRTAQHIVNEYRASLDRSCDFGIVVLRTPSSIRAGIEYIINDCCLDGISTMHPEDGENIDNEPVCAVRLRLGYIQLHRFRRRRIRRQRQLLPPTVLGRSSRRQPAMF